MENNKQIINVLPINDIRPHIESQYCLCKPIIEEEGLLIIHNAYDGRDRVEQFEAQIND